MAIALSLDAKKQLRGSIKRYVAENLEQERAIHLEGVCFEKEFRYWPAPAAPRPGRRGEV